MRIEKKQNIMLIEKQTTNEYDHIQKKTTEYVHRKKINDAAHIKKTKYFAHRKQIQRNMIIYNKKQMTLIIEKNKGI